jgi:hypothetical protein
MNQSGYVPGNGAVGGNGTVETGHGARKKQYLAYLSAKDEEIKEQQDARRYYHGSQWTADQLKILRQRKQPPITFNRVARKINGTVGILSKQRMDPRGYPRTQKDEAGAELATAALRYVCDTAEWPEKDAQALLDGAIDGIAGVELLIEQSNLGPNDFDVTLAEVDPAGIFYDPRSVRANFSDARYMGVGKWADIETVIEMFPDREEEIRSSIDSDSELTSDPDTDRKWYDQEDGINKVRLVDHWYIQGGEWYFCVYTGSLKLMEGISPYRDEKGKTFCKYLLWSANVDHDGDRYGFVRILKSPQDEINARRSKALHQLNTRRMIVQDGQGLDIDTIRKESNKPDGVIIYPAGTEAPTFDDAAKAGEMTGQLNMLVEAKTEIENYGFNPALVGSGVNQMSGRAMQMQQHAGMAELGPFASNYRNWKIRVYRAIWHAIRQFWTAERWVRVTDDDGLAQFLGVNQLVVNPQTGAPAIQNPIGQLDVDIIIDEGPDTINMQMDAYDTLSVMATKGAQVPPEVLIELSPLSLTVKKKVLGMIDQARQQQSQAQAPVAQLEMAGKQADMQKTQAETAKIVMETQTMGQEAQVNAQTEAVKAQATMVKAQADIEKARMGVMGSRMDMMNRAAQPMNGAL